MSGPTLPGFAELRVNYSDEWYTPRWILDPLGYFDLDPCSPLDRPWDTAGRHLTIEDDGLTSPWAGRVWCNPPYSEVDQWVKKLADHGDGTALVFARTETAYWQDHVWPRATGVLFLRGRVAFHRGNAAAEGSAGAPSALVAYGALDWQMLVGSGLPGALIPLGSHGGTEVRP